MHSELLQLLEKLGYNQLYPDAKYWHPNHRKLIYVGDFTDWGPYPVEVLKLVMKQVHEGIALAVIGNHDDKIRRYLRDEISGEKIRVQIYPAFSETLERINAEELKNPGFKVELYLFLCSLPHKLILEDVIVSHAAVIEGKKPKVEREIALVGEVDGRRDAKGHPIRKDNWKFNYSGPAKFIVVGHQRYEDVTLNVSKTGTLVYSIDTGVAYGGKLSCLRLPEQEIVSVPAKKAYRFD